MMRRLALALVLVCGCSGDPAQSPLSIGQKVQVYDDKLSDIVIHSLDGQPVFKSVPIGTRAFVVREGDMDSAYQSDVQARKVAIRFTDGEFQGRTAFMARMYLRPVD
jgi:hypothetical protein